jgi:hypothetical protein
VRLNSSLLKQQHVGIIDAIKTLNALLVGSFADAAALLGQARMALARLIAEHLKSEEELLHGPLKTHRLTDQISSYAAIAAATRDLRIRYSAHISDWPMRTIEANWQAYVVEARRLSEAVASLAAREEQEIYPAAEQLLAGIR